VRLLVGALVDLDAQLAAGAGLRGADQRAVLTRERHGAPPPGRRICSETSAIVPTSRNSFSWRRDEHDALVIAHVDRERDPHVGEHDGVIKCDQAEALLG